MKIDDPDFELIMESELSECEGNWTATYWKYTALSRKRLWKSGEKFRVYFGDDEYWRRTLVLGPIVIALWTTRAGRAIAYRLSKELNNECF